jgi:hypothetical protein
MCKNWKQQLNQIQSFFKIANNAVLFNFPEFGDHEMHLIYSDSIWCGCR